MECSPSETDCSSMGPPWGHKSCQQTCSSMGSSPHGATGPARSLLQHGVYTGSQPPSGIPLLWWEVLPTLQVEICSTLGLHRLWGHSLPHHGLLHRLQGTACLTMGCFMGCGGISAPAPGVHPAPPSPLTLVSAELFLSHILTFFSCSFCCAFFFRFLTMLSQRFYHHCWLSWPCPVAGPSWSQLALAPLDIGEASGSFSQKLPVQPPCYQNFAMQSQHNMCL